MIDSVMELDQSRAGWVMIENMASFAVSKGSLERHDTSILVTAIIRVVLEFFSYRNQLNEPLVGFRVICSLSSVFLRVRSLLNVCSGEKRNICRLLWRF